MLNQGPVRHCGRCGQLCTSGISIFGGLDREDQRSLIKIARHVDIKKGQVLFETGDQANRIIAMRYGRLKLRRLTAEGQEMVLGYLGSGEVMGEDTLYADALYDMDLVAAEDSGVCLIQAEAVSALALSRPQLGVGLLNSLGKKLHAARQLTDVLSRRQATARLAGFLLHQGAGELSLSREEMAASVGLRRETVSRALATLSRLGAIQLSGYRRVRVVDPVALQEIFSEDAVL